MASLFDDANTQFSEVDSTPVSIAPFTLAYWGQPNDDTIQAIAFGIFDKDQGSFYFALSHDGLQGDKINFILQGTGNVQVFTTTSFTKDVWSHACGVNVSSTDHRVYLNGGSVGTSATETVADLCDRITVGRAGTNSPSNYFSGDIAECAIWNVALSETEVQTLAAGYSPLFVRPGSLVFYDPMIRSDSGDDTHDIIGGLTLVGQGGTGVPVTSNHPRIIRPSGLYVPGDVVAAPAGSILPQIVSSQHQMQGVA